MLIAADQSLMTQLMVNLIGNAIKYGRNGGNVWLNAAIRDDGTHITVADDGIGISGKDLPRIFERFYRMDQSRNSQTGGHGIGLSIAKAIVTAHRGKISAASVDGQSLTVSVSLPV